MEKQSNGFEGLKVITSDYSIDFSEHSIQEATKELSMRDELRKVKAREINELKDEIYNKLPDDLKSKFNYLISLCQVVGDDAIEYGRTDRYLYVAEMMRVNLLFYIFHNMFKREGVEKTEELIKWYSDYALFNILVLNVDKGDAQKELVKRYGGGNEVFWTRIKDTNSAQQFKGFMQTINELNLRIEQRLEEEESSEAEKADREIFDNFKEAIKKDIPNCLGMVIKSEMDVVEDRLEVGRDDWNTAVELKKMGNEAKGIEFLKKQGASEKTIEKFVKLRVK